MSETIDTAIAKRMVEAAAIGGASIIGQPGGWTVMLKLGVTEKPLGAQRTDKPRIWRSLDRCVEYLKNELHIECFDKLDATNYSPISADLILRKDTSERMKRTHEAATHDKWFREQINEALIEADEPSTVWLTHESVKTQSAARRAEWAKRTPTEEKP